MTGSPTRVQSPARRRSLLRSKSAAPKKKDTHVGVFFLEQGTGVEPALTAWEAAVIPIYQPCERCYYNRSAGDLQPEILSKRMISAVPA